MNKILYVVTRTELGGAQKCVMSLVNSRPHGYNAVVAAGTEDLGHKNEYLYGSCTDYNIKFHQLPSLQARISPKKDFRALIEIIKLIKVLKPDIIHLHSTKAGLIGRMAALITRTPAVFTAHGWAFTEGVKLSRKAAAIITECISASFTKRIITVSRYDEKIANKWLIGVKNKTLTIENGIPDICKQRQNKNSGRIRVTMVARFAPQKDHHSLIRAVALLSDIELVLVGDGPLVDESKALVGELNISDRVQFLGSRSDIPEILAQSDAFALISNYEGFPISTLEAMRAALPVIVTDVGGAAESVIPGITGFVVPKGDIEAIANSLITLVNDSERRKSMGRASRKHFLNKYQEKDMVAKTFQVYEEILKARRL